MLRSGIKELNDSTRKHIRRYLESELGNSMQFLPDDKGKLLGVHGNVTLSDVAEIGNWS